MEKQSFRYSFLLRVMYRYGNIPATFILILYLLPSLFNFHGLKIVYSIILITFIYFVNRYFVYLYRRMPYSIEAGDDGLHCTRFFFSHKSVSVPYSAITDITGGIFDRRFTKLISIHYAGGKILFFSTIKNGRVLQDILLRNVNPELYKTILDRIGIRT